MDLNNPKWIKIKDNPPPPDKKVYLKWENIIWKGYVWSSPHDDWIDFPVAEYWFEN